MILNVSGRTDIVAFYSKWFIKRYEEGYVDVRNPFYPKKISRIYFKDVDAILFCTKNPIPIINYLDKIDKPILFHVTLTPYKKDIEPNVPDKKLIIEAIKKVSDIVGIDNIYIRYDPVFINEKYTLEYHKKAFEKMCSLLNGYVKHIIISFLDEYKNVLNNINEINPKKLEASDYKFIGENFSKIASEFGMTVQTCMEEKNLIDYGFIKGECLSFNTAYRLTGKTNFKKWKARNCSCAEMVDIGVYNSCKHFCKYCYANYDEKQVNSNCLKHDINSSLLIGNIKDDDIIKIRNT
jgi:DNA repair photolyase